MGDFIKSVIKEPEIRDANAYLRRIYYLSGIYLCLFVATLCGCAVLIWQVKYYVTLTQRSNVETLTLLFFLVFFAYLALLSRTGAVGAWRVFYHAFRGFPHGSLPLKECSQRGRRRLLATAALNVVLEHIDLPHQSFELPVGQAATMGRLRIDGARLEHYGAQAVGSNNLFAYFAEQLRQILERRLNAPVNIDVVAWKSLDDETTEQYLGQVKFACNLSRHLGCSELWPKVTVTAADCAAVEEALAAICPALQLESFLPEWEYRGEHKLPVIPEPLGFIALTRSEPRVDPLTSMSAALVVVLTALALLAFLIFFPPWVPGV